ATSASAARPSGTTRRRCGLCFRRSGRATIGGAKPVKTRHNDRPTHPRGHMRFARTDAKAYARAKLKGIWAAALTPFRPDGALAEDGFRRNLRHWVDELGIDGVFVSGKQGEFFSMSLAERKRTFDIAVEEIGGARTILSCSDQSLDTVIELARYAQAIGSDYIVVHAPVLHSSPNKMRRCSPTVTRSAKRSASALRFGAIRIQAT